MEPRPAARAKTGRNIEEQDNLREVVVVPPSRRESDAQDAAEPLKSRRVSEIEGMPENGRWLVEGIWTTSGVGLVAGMPKTGKTWWALELAVSIASGIPVLGRFPVQNPGPVIVFTAEDDYRASRDRVFSLAAHKGADFDTLPLYLITEDRLRIDEAKDRTKLEQLLAAKKPCMLILDPLVRLHGGDENYAGHIAEVLGYLREVQRRFGVAIVVTHHLSKTVGRRGGAALRGSSDIYAWADCLTYLARDGDQQTVVSFEHRSAAAPEPLGIRVLSGPQGAHLECLESGSDEGDFREPKAPSERGRSGADLKAAREPLGERVLAELRAASWPLSQVVLRARLRVRNSSLQKALSELKKEGQIMRDEAGSGWVIDGAGGASEDSQAR